MKKYLKNMNWTQIETWSKEKLYELEVSNCNYNHILSFLATINYGDEWPKKNEVLENTKDIFEGLLKMDNDLEISDEIDIIIYSIMKIEAKNEKFESEIQQKLISIQSGKHNWDISEKFKLVLFVCKTPVKNWRTQKIEKFKSEFPDLDFDIEYVEFSDIQQKWNNLYRSQESVSEFIFRMDDKENVLISPTKDSVVINVSAKDIKEVYQKFGSNCGPLYASNLRYYITNKNIDRDLSSSIRENNISFWYKNNGIVIICDRYEISTATNEIKLFDFSVINGGQTCHMIGLTEFDHDFYVMSKIISSRNMNNIEDKNDFIEKIAIATNSQKPIKSEDTIAVQQEIKTFSNEFNKISTKYGEYLLVVKRGQQKNKALTEKYRTLSLKSLGQLGLASILILVGAAKNQHNKIFTKENKAIIFDKQYVDYYKGMRKLWICINDCRLKKLTELKNSPDWTNKYVQIFSTGQWFIFMIVIFIYCLFKFPNFNENIKSLPKDNDEQFKQLFSDFIKQNYKNILFISGDVNDKDLEEIVNRASSIISDGYDQLKGSQENITFANFTKIDNNFIKIMKYIINELPVKTSSFKELFQIIELYFNEK